MSWQQAGRLLEAMPCILRATLCQPTLARDVKDSGLSQQLLHWHTWRRVTSAASAKRCDGLDATPGCGGESEREGQGDGEGESEGGGWR